MNNKVLLIGGAGYIGAVVIKHLLDKKYNVTCLDNLIYNNSYSLREFEKNNEFNFVFGDLRDDILTNELLNKCDAVIILAGLVGDPITKKYPIESALINDKGVKNVIDLCSKRNNKKFIFISTCSNYGLVGNNDIADENYDLNPLSDYAKHKVCYCCQAESDLRTCRSP